MNLRETWFTLVQVAYDLFLKLNPRKLDARAVILDEAGRVLLLRSRYAGRLLLPGGGIGRGEHLDEALRRECREEIGLEPVIEGLTGLYYRAATAVYIAVFRCHLPAGVPLQLSHEHSEACWLSISDLPPALQPFVADALEGSTRPAVRRVP
jgi:8-oxo-dGTP diphosphatase